MVRRQDCFSRWGGWPCVDLIFLGQFGINVKFFRDKKKKIVWLRQFQLIYQSSVLLDVVSEFFNIQLLKWPEEFQLWHYRVALSVYGTMEWLEQCPRESRCVSMNLNCSASVPGWWPCPVSRTDHVQGVTRYSSVVLPRSELRQVTNRILINRKRTFETNLATWMILEELLLLK